MQQLCRGEAKSCGQDQHEPPNCWGNSYTTTTHGDSYTAAADTDRTLSQKYAASANARWIIDYSKKVLQMREWSTSRSTKMMQRTDR